MPDLPQRPSLEHLRKQAKARKRERATSLSQAQHELAREYGFDSWPKLVHHVQAARLEGIERALVLADPAALSEVLQADRAAATAPVGGLPPLLVLLRRSSGSAADTRDCARLLLDAGADPNSHTVEWGGEGRMTALFDAVERGDLELARLLLERGAERDEDAFYHACEQGETAFLDLLHAPGLSTTSSTSRTPRACIGSSTAASTSTPIAACTMRSRGAAGCASSRCCSTPAPTRTCRGTAGTWGAGP